VDSAPPADLLCPVMPVDLTDFGQTIEAVSAIDRRIRGVDAVIHLPAGAMWMRAMWPRRSARRRGDHHRERQYRDAPAKPGTDGRVASGRTHERWRWPERDAVIDR